MKLMHSTTPLYRHTRGVKPHPIALHLTLQRLLTVTLFCFVVFSFTFILSSNIEGDKITTNDNARTTMSTDGKNGVSMPVVPTAKGNPNTALINILGASTNSLTSTPLSIPPKPSWIYLPLYKDPNNAAAQYLSSNPSAKGGKYIARLAQTPISQWFGDWNSNVKNDVNNYVSAADSAGSVPIVVLYNIPNRDCGGYSTGGASGTNAYIKWIHQVADGIGRHPTVVVLEPDALGALDCLPAVQQPERTESIAQAVTILKSHSQTAVYVDAGTPVWQPANVMASRLKAASVAEADGFSLNVSYFANTALNQVYGDQLSSLIGYKHYVIDTSRNGGNKVVTGMQCNPSFASYGETPTTNTGNVLNDALLWIKIPWESDGACNGSPGPGEPYWDYALQLAQNAGW